MNFFRKAQFGNNHPLLYLVGIACVFLGLSLGVYPRDMMLASAIRNNPELGSEELNAFNTNPDFSVFGIDPNMGFFLLLFPFILGLIIFYFLFPVLHGRKFQSLINSKGKLDFSKLIFGFILWLFIGFLFESVMYFMNPEAFSFNFDAKRFIPLLILSLLILPIQTSLEELLFRSYLLQGIANLEIKLSPTIMILGAWIITSVLFGMMHLANPEVHKFGLGLMMTYYISAGLFLGLITIWDDGLELALGVHAATNFLGAVIIGYDGAAIQTDSLFKTSEFNVLHMIIGLYICFIVFILICKRKYAWTNNPIAFKEMT